MTTLFKKNAFYFILLTGITFSCTGSKQTTSNTKVDSEAQKQTTPITITGADYGEYVKIGSKYTSETLDVSKINSLPSEGENQVWDLRAYELPNHAHVREQTHDNHPVPATTAFTSATFTRNHQSDFIKDFNYTEFYEVSNEGFYKLGFVVDKATANLGNGIFLKSTGKEDVMTPKDLIFKFPMYYGEKTHYEGVVEEEYILTAPPLGLSDAPAGRKLTFTVKSEVVGWGRVILPDAALEDTTEVLLVKNTESVTANYFVNGNTAPDVLLNMLKLKEGGIHEMVF